MKSFHLICDNCGSTGAKFVDYYTFSSRPNRELTDIMISCDKCGQTADLAEYAKLPELEENNE